MVRYEIFKFKWVGMKKGKRYIIVNLFRESSQETFNLQEIAVNEAMLWPCYMKQHITI